MFISFMAASPVPYIYSVFVRNVNPKKKFSELEKAQMMAKNSIYLLPPFHSNRNKLIAWVVSNNYPSNNRVEFAKAISNFIKVGKCFGLIEFNSGFMRIFKEYDSLGVYNTNSTNLLDRKGNLVLHSSIFSHLGVTTLLQSQKTRE